MSQHEPNTKNISEELDNDIDEWMIELAQKEETYRKDPLIRVYDLLLHATQALNLTRTDIWLDNRRLTRLDQLAERNNRP